MRKIVEFGYCLRSLDSQEQVVEILERYQLKNSVKPFNRCLVCNQELAWVEKASIIDRLEPLTIKHFDEFKICSHCGQLYWKGSHYDRMVQYITAWMRGTEAVRANFTLEEGEE